MTNDFMIDIAKILHSKFSNAKIIISLKVNNLQVSSGEMTVEHLTSGPDYGIDFSKELIRGVISEFFNHVI
jgi:hypothetical protein